jgi:predicted RND superfamily exporter protein
MSEHSGEPLRTFGRWVIRWRWPVILVSIAIAVMVGRNARHLELDDDYRLFFSKENPQLQAFEALERIYTKNDNIMFIIRPADANVFTRETLTAIKWLTEAAWKIPYAIRVDSITNFQHTRADGDDLIVTDLVEDPATMTDGDLEAVRAVALTEPQLRIRMISEDGSTTGVSARLQVPRESLTEFPEAANYARQLREEFLAKFPSFEVRLTGGAMLSNAFGEAPKADLQLLIPLMYAILIASMLWFMRSIAAMISIVFVVILATAMAMGVAGWYGLKLNGVSVMAPTIILTLSIADSVHILVSMFAAMRTGASRDDALVESLRINAQPVFLTSFTTAIGFLSLNFSDAPPLRDLGNITAGGVMAAWVYSMTFLPAAVSLRPMRHARAVSGVEIMDRLAEFVIAWRRALGIGLLLGAVVLVSATTLFEINDDPVEYFAERIEFRRDTDFASQYLTSVYDVAYSLGAGESGGINEPEYLRRVDRFANWLRAQPTVHHVNTFTDVMKRLNKNMHGDDPQYYRLPEERELAAQYLLLYEMSLPYGLDVNDQINIDKSATRLNVILRDVDFKGVKELKAVSEDWLEKNGLPSMRSEAASPMVMFSYIAERNIYAMVRGTAIAFALISLTLVVALRSLKIGAISLIPNTLPAAVAFGIWALVYREVGFAVSVVAGTSIGIIVDDTVHFLSKYLRARREQGLGSADAVRYAFHTVGIALIVTSAILIIGFAALATSAFWPNATLGLLTALTIACALVADFFLLPPLLMALDL